MSDPIDSDLAPRWWLHPALARLALGDASWDAGETTAPPKALPFIVVPEPATALDLDDPAQRELGDYELLELIGRGGMGVVYRARQHGLDREVAIKLLASGPRAPDEFVDGFRREARNAAALQHPNIVVVHEMGEHAGRVFYAMQLVRGRSLGHHLEASGTMAPRAAAALLRQVAEAVDYAHRLGVLHLDLKPGNILINQDGEPLVTDFGLARRLEQARGVAIERVCGTPSYMAPEQAQLGVATLSPATDVWGLGAVLYELLTGQPPFVAGDVAATARLLIDGTVRRPSRWARVPADLEAITLKCLRKSPLQRYQSARALADDLGLFLAGRAVMARPLNALQRLKRWTRREPGLAAASCIALLSLAAGLAASTWLWQRAEASASLAREVSGFLNDQVLAPTDPYQDIETDPTRITVPRLLAEAEAKLDRGLVRQPAARAQVGLSLGRAYAGLGLWRNARDRLSKAREEARARLGRDAPLTLDIEQQLGIAATRSGDHAQAHAIYRHLLESRQRLSGADDPRTIAARTGRAQLLSATGQYEAALAELSSVHDVASRHATDQLADIEWMLAVLHAETNRWDRAEALTRSALARVRLQLGPRHPQYLWATSSLGEIHLMRGQWSAAEAVFRTMHDGFVASLGPQHPKTLVAFQYLGQVRLERGDPKSALPMLRQALHHQIGVHGESDRRVQYGLNFVGQALVDLRRPAEAIVLLERALQLATAAGRRREAGVLLVLNSLACAYLAAGQPHLAEARLEEALAAARQTLPANNMRRGLLERTMGDLRVQQGRTRQARAHYRRAEAMFSEGFGDHHRWVVDVRRRLQGIDAAEHGTTRGRARLDGGPGPSPATQAASGHTCCCRRSLGGSRASVSPRCESSRSVPSMSSASAVRLSTQSPSFA